MQEIFKGNADCNSASKISYFLMCLLKTFSFQHSNFNRVFRSFVFVVNVNVDEPLSCLLTQILRNATKNSDKPISPFPLGVKHHLYTEGEIHRCIYLMHWAGNTIFLISCIFNEKHLSSVSLN